MAISHKFKDFDFGDGFGTQNSILSMTPYKPEILILGTFNPDTPNSNFADFFYGRNFFWPAFNNLFCHNQLILTSRRIPNRGNLPIELNPTLQEIKELSLRLKLTFADLISDVLHINNPIYDFLNNDNIIYNHKEYNLIQDGKKNSVLGLENLNTIGQIKWTTDSIINYLIENPQIHSIYFTRKPTGVWGDNWNQIINNREISNRSFTNIFTPSGQGAPVKLSMERLLNHWVFNNNPNFGKLDNNWLIQNNVNLNEF